LHKWEAGLCPSEPAPGALLVGVPQPQMIASSMAASADGSAHLDVLATVRDTVVHFIEQSRGEAAADFTDRTPFMDAGLDSLDIMKVRQRCNIASSLPSLSMLTEHLGFGHSLHPASRGSMHHGSNHKSYTRAVTGGQVTELVSLLAELLLPSSAIVAGRSVCLIY